MKINEKMVKVIPGGCTLTDELGRVHTEYCNSQCAVANICANKYSATMLLKYACASDLVSAVKRAAGTQ